MADDPMCPLLGSSADCVDLVVLQLLFFTRGVAEDRAGPSYQREDPSTVHINCAYTKEAG